MKAIKPTTLAALATALLLGACGGSGTQKAAPSPSPSPVALSARAYRESVGAAAQPFQDAFLVTSPTDVSQAGKRALDDTIAALDGLKLELARLNAPSEFAAAHRDLQSAVDQLLAALRFLREEHAREAACFANPTPDLTTCLLNSERFVALMKPANELYIGAMDKIAPVG